MKKEKEPEFEGEIQVAMMTRIANVPERQSRQYTATCPKCGEPCYFDKANMHLAYTLYGNALVPLCTLCGMQGHHNKGTIGLWLKRKHTTPHEVYLKVMESVVDEKQ